MSYLDKQGRLYGDLKDLVDGICDCYGESGCKDCPMCGVRDLMGEKVCSNYIKDDELAVFKEQILDALDMKEVCTGSQPMNVEQPQTGNDAVNHPSHYNQGGIECIDALDAMVTGYPDPVAAALTWQVGKYIWRHPFKEKPLEDLKKARFYLDRLIEMHERSRA